MNMLYNVRVFGDYMTPSVSGPFTFDGAMHEFNIVCARLSASGYAVSKGDSAATLRMDGVYVGRVLIEYVGDDCMARFNGKGVG